MLYMFSYNVMCFSLFSLYNRHLWRVYLKAQRMNFHNPLKAPERCAWLSSVLHSISGVTYFGSPKKNHKIICIDIDIRGR